MTAFYERPLLKRVLATLLTLLLISTNILDVGGALIANAAETKADETIDVEISLEDLQELLDEHGTDGIGFFREDIPQFDSVYETEEEREAELQVLTDAMYEKVSEQLEGKIVLEIRTFSAYPQAAAVIAVNAAPAYADGAEEIDEEGALVITGVYIIGINTSAQDTYEFNMAFADKGLEIDSAQVDAYSFEAELNIDEAPAEEAPAGHSLAEVSSA